MLALDAMQTESTRRTDCGEAVIVSFWREYELLIK
jgi:hypothetical protein